MPVITQPNIDINKRSGDVNEFPPLTHISPPLLSCFQGELYQHRRHSQLISILRALTAISIETVCPTKYEVMLQGRDKTSTILNALHLYFYGDFGREKIYVIPWLLVYCGNLNWEEIYEIYVTML